MGAGVSGSGLNVGVSNCWGLSGGGGSVNQRAAPAVQPPSLEPPPKPSTPAKGQPATVRTRESRLGDALGSMSVQKPPTAPGKVETKYSYKPGEKGGAGSFPAEVTTTLDGGAKVIVKGTASGTSIKDITSVQGSVPIPRGAGSVEVGVKDRQSIFGVGIKQSFPVGGKNWTLTADTSAVAPNNGTNKGVVTTGVSLSAPAGAAEVKADVKLVGAQEPGKSTTGYGVGVSVPLRQKDQAIEGRIGYENNPASARKDQYSATLGYKFGSDKRIDVEVTTGADSGTTVQGRIRL
jgi:hypothetical protein